MGDHIYSSPDFAVAKLSFENHPEILNAKDFMDALQWSKEFDSSMEFDGSIKCFLYEDTDEFEDEDIRIPNIDECKGARMPVLMFFSADQHRSSCDCFDITQAANTTREINENQYSDVGSMLEVFEKAENKYGDLSKYIADCRIRLWLVINGSNAYFIIKTKQKEN